MAMVMVMAAATTTSLIILRRRSTIFFPSLRTPLPTTSSAPLLRLHTPAFCSNSAITEVSESVPDVVDVHPWPEWEGFLEKLKGKGYFDRTSSAAEEDAEDGGVRLTSPSNYTRAKVACLGFARERPDLLRRLPKEDILTVVECGCPNLLRKSVNSAKRLRAYLKIDEGDVCSSCNLRGTCDRAYVMVKKEEGASRTVDIVRLLLQYAAELPVVESGKKPSIKESVEESVRKLLAELIKLSDTEADPEIINAILKPQLREKLPQVAQVRETKQHQNSEMKTGDWICTQCDFMNFARNVLCRQCKTDGPKRVNNFDSTQSKRGNFDSSKMRKGDWTCSKCDYLNYSRNVRCLECETDRPKQSPYGFEMKKGDWTCSQCQFMNFARNTRCRQCQESRPKKDLEPGEWECLKCNFLNFRRNNSCLKCNGDRPRDESDQYDDDVWRRPKFSAVMADLL